MASELIPYSLFAENVSESIFGPKAATDEEKHGNLKIWNSDKGGDVVGIKQEQVHCPGNRIRGGDHDFWSAGHEEALEEDLFLHNRRFVPPSHKEQWKGTQNFKSDLLDVESFRQRGLCRESIDWGMDLKSSFAAVIEWIGDLKLETGELEGAARIESRSKQVDPKYWLAGLSDIEHPNAGNMCASGGKPGNIIRENNLLLAEWGAHSYFWQRSEGDLMKISYHDDYNRNGNMSAFNDKVNQGYQEKLLSPWNAVDIMFGFHIPINEEVELSPEQGRDFEMRRQGSSLEKISVKIGDLVREMNGTDKRSLALSEEEVETMLKQSAGEFMHEPTVDLGTLFGGTIVVPKSIDPAIGIESVIKEYNFTTEQQLRMQADFIEPATRSIDHDCSGSGRGGEDIVLGTSGSHSNREAAGGSPHEAIFFTLSYLSLQDLFSVERVCKSLRAAVNNDALLWRHLHVEHPLSKKLTNEALLQLSARAQGHLQCLSLVECVRITDDGLKRVLDISPKLTKLCLPGCTRISAEGIVRMVKGHRKQKGDGMPGLKQLRIRGLYGITKEHLENLKSSLDDGLQKNPETVKQQFYHNGHYSSSYDDDRSIDIEVCPKCGNARLVYDCTRERCQQKKDHKLQQCRGCIFCIARCEECGRCIDDNEFEETFCLDLLCSACWLQLPKCLECNRPGCGRHADHFIRRPDTTFVCGDCRGMPASSLGPEFHGFA